MKKMMACVTLSIAVAAWADYTVTMEMPDPDNPKVHQTSVLQYKDAKHGRVDFRDAKGKRVSSMLVRGDKSYMISYGKNGPQVTDMDAMRQSMAQYGGGTQDTDAQQSQDDVKWVNTGKKKRVGEFSGEVWKATYKEEGRKETKTIVMSRDKDLLKAMEAYMDMMQRIGGEAQDDKDNIFSLKPGYVPVEIEDSYKVTSLNKDKIDSAVFELPKGAEVSKSPFGSMFASNDKQGSGAKGGGLADACYEQVCCGQVQGDAKTLSNMVAKKTMGYKLEATAACDFLGLGALIGANAVEGAMYKQGKKAVTVTLNSDAKDKGIVLKTKEGEADGGPAKATGYKTGFIGEYVYHYAVLTPMNVQQLDIIIDGQTLISLSHPVAQGKVPLVKFAKEAIDFNAYKTKGTKAASEVKPKKSDKPKADSAESSDGLSADKINKGVDEAVDMFKSLF